MNANLINLKNKSINTIFKWSLIFKALLIFGLTLFAILSKDHGFSSFLFRKHSSIVIIFTIIILIPILEEFIFRWHISKHNNASLLKKSILLPLFLICYLFITSFNIFSFTFGLILLFSYYIFFVKREYNPLIHLLLTSFCFAISHQITTTGSLNVILIIFHLFSGLFLGSIAIKFGLKWSIIAHILWNSIMFSMNIKGQLDTELKTIKTTYTTVKYSESGYFNYFNLKSLNGDNKIIFSNINLTTDLGKTLTNKTNFDNINFSNPNNKNITDYKQLFKHYIQKKSCRVFNLEIDDYRKISIEDLLKSLEREGLIEQIKPLINF